MTKKQKAQMDEFWEEMDTVKGMEATHSGDVDMPEDVMLLEEDYPDEQEEEEYSEEEIEAFLDNVSLDDTPTNLSFDDMMPKRIKKTGITYQQKEKTITPHYLVLRKLTKQSPTVCTYKDCFFDAAQAIGYKDYSKLPEKKRRIAAIALERHTQEKHKFTTNDIVDEAEIPSSWLSPTL
jgi:hypothetical protein